MKRLGFILIISFVLQNLVLAQPDYGIFLGGGIWWAKCNETIANSEISPAFNAGLFLGYPIVNNLYIVAELNYTYLMSNYSYKAVVDTVNWIVVGEGESASDYQQLSIPLLIGYKYGKLKPFLGFEYSYRFSESWLKKRINSFGLMGGLNYRLSDKFTLELNYYYGITKDYEYKGVILDPDTIEKIGEYDNYWKSSRLGLTLYYSFRKDKHKELGTAPNTAYSQ